MNILKVRRAVLGKSQYKIATLAGMSQSKYSAIERGDWKPDRDDKKAIAEAMGAQINELWPNYQS